MTRKPAKEKKITPQKAIEVLRKNGIEVDEKEAKIILDFLYILAENAINQYFKSE